MAEHRMTLHEYALALAERRNPGGEHRVTRVDINGPVTEPGDAVVDVVSRARPVSDRIDIAIHRAKL